MAKLTQAERETLATYNAYGAQWAREHSLEGYWEEELQLLRRYLPQGRILEIGCGVGRDAKALIDAGYEYVGVEPSKTFLELARQHNPRARFHGANIYTLRRYRRKPFDGFWCAAVLLHIPKKRIDEALSSIRGVLRDRAVGFLAVKKGSGERMETLPFGEGEPKRFFTYYSFDEFQRVLSQNGFIVLHGHERPMTEKTTWLCYFVRKG